MPLSKSQPNYIDCSAAFAFRSMGMDFVEHQGKRRKLKERRKLKGQLLLGLMEDTSKWTLDPNEDSQVLVEPSDVEEEEEPTDASEPSTQEQGDGSGHKKESITKEPESN